jgi:hypothetical protein
VDEKTGIQALERLEQRAPLSKGHHKHNEFEYLRHGTTTLMAAYSVASGSILYHPLNPTRTEEDFCRFIEQTCQPLLADRQAGVILWLINSIPTSRRVWSSGWPSKSAFVERWAKKAHRGILQNQSTRMAFLEEESHRVGFVYTPKHCSWLNPIENYFAKLQRHVIQNPSFTCVPQLNAKFEAIFAIITLVC